jgi:hypothetical protein
MGYRKPRYFLLAYYDDDAKTFNVTGPITDDTAVTNRTVELQKSGRNVRISTASNLETEVSKVPDPKDRIHLGPRGYKYDPNLKW